VNLDRFVQERQEAWNELASAVAEAKRRPERLGPGGVRRLGALYRGAAADLALARRRFPGDPVVRRLEELVGRARHLVYDTRPRRGSLVRFLTRDYWRLIAERPLPLLVAVVLTFAPAGLSAAWALHSPAQAIGLVPAQFRPAVESDRFEAYPADVRAEFSSAVFTNNVRVAALAFAGGIALGLLTALLLVFNGVILGAVAGLMIGAGNGKAFVDLVTAHGVLELTCIVIAGTAGLRLGWSIVEPGRRTRTESVGREARRSVAIVIGTAPWLGIAGIVEGYRGQLSQAGLGAVVGVGVSLGVLYWGLVLFRGFLGPRAEPEI
jgi:uncharacterized membrane protein SpoIIM required for sporulation